MANRQSPFAVLTDDRVRRVLERLHAESDRQMPGLLLHYLPRLPRLLLGGRIDFAGKDHSYYADKYLALAADQAAFCHVTALALRATTIVEFGMSFGISTIWLAAAARTFGGRVITTELVPEKAERARRNFEDAGLAEHVEVRVGDARDTLRGLDGPVDMLLNDGFPAAALDVVKLVAPHMRPGGVIVTDNVGHFPADYADYLRWLRDPNNGFCSLLVPYRSGTEYSARRT